MKLLVIGCGSVGQRHAENALAYTEVAVCDTSVNMLEECVQKLNVSGFSTLNEALAWQPDGTIIATPHSTHLNLAELVLDSGSDVLIEKPISHTLDEVDRLLSKAEKLGRKIYVVSNMRFHRAIGIIHETLNELGGLLFSRSHYGNYLPNMRADRDYTKLYCSSRSSGGGVILDAIHEIDYLMWLFGGVSNITCTSDKISDLHIDVEDYACISMQHDCGFKSEIHLDYLQQHKRRGCEVIGSKGTIIWQSEGKSPEKCQVKKYLTKTNKWETVFDSEVNINEAYIKTIKSFVDEINGVTTILSDGYSGRNALIAALAAHKSSGNGARIRLGA